ncbi:hypothetical protein VNO77_36557 [Canavalia gladiata]|uniref:Uncharacterized protein n=1 Tax=Canavalia gladiata TaxID=3824 RepID=A0AAN9KAL4_CANGL
MNADMHSSLAVHHNFGVVEEVSWRGGCLFLSVLQVRMLLVRFKVQQTNTNPTVPILCFPSLGPFFKVYATLEQLVKLGLKFNRQGLHSAP